MTKNQDQDNTPDNDLSYFRTHTRGQTKSLASEPKLKTDSTNPQDTTQQPLDITIDPPPFPYVTAGPEKIVIPLAPGYNYSALQHTTNQDIGNEENITSALNARTEIIPETRLVDCRSEVHTIAKTNEEISCRSSIPMRSIGTAQQPPRNMTKVTVIYTSLRGHPQASAVSTEYIKGLKNTSKLASSHQLTPSSSSYKNT